MKVLIISSVAIPTPPPEYGGLEQVAWDIAEELVKMGNTVCLVGSQESKDLEGGLTLRTVPASFTASEQQAYYMYKEMLDGFDIIHDHSWQKWVYLDKIDRDIKKEGKDLKIISTVHSQSPYSKPPPVQYPCFVGVSQAHAMYMSGIYGIPVKGVSNGINLDKYKLQEEKGDRYLFVGRNMKEKGLHELIQLFRELRLPLDIVCEDVNVPDQRYVLQQIEKCDGHLIKYWGKVDREGTAKMMQNAKALVHTPLMPYLEVFGLNLAEANAAGTPVFVLNNLATPEVIKHKVTGYVCKNMVAMKRAIQRFEKGTLTFDPFICRKHVEKYFSRELMTIRYYELYRQMLEGLEW